MLKSPPVLFGNKRRSSFLCYCNDLNRALLGTGAAVCALFRINRSKEIRYSDSAGRTNLGAHHAANAAGGANLADNCPLIVTGAAYYNMVLYRNHTDEQMRASLGTGAAAGAQLLIYMGYPIYNGKRTEFADLNTVAIAQAAITAGFFPAVQCRTGGTGLRGAPPACWP